MLVSKMKRGRVVCTIRLLVNDRRLAPRISARTPLYMIAATNGFDLAVTEHNESTIESLVQRAKRQGMPWL